MGLRTLRPRKQKSGEKEESFNVVEQESAKKESTNTREKSTVVVTGGSGFLGRHIVEQLKKSNEYDSIRVMDIRVPEQGDRVEGVEYVGCDLRKQEQVDEAIDGASVVIHTATAAPTGANAYNHGLMESVNVDGTRHVIESCWKYGVKALVYTSSASVVFDGKDLVMVNEDVPYASKPLDFYTVTKIEGEKLVLAANGKHGLLTCSLRPSGIFGEYDQLTVPTIIAKAKAGKMKYIIGSGENMMDWTYAGNVAHAHILAASHLLQAASQQQSKGQIEAKAGGKAYFITNNDPKPFWGMMGDICQGLGYGRPRIHLPFMLVMAIACFVQYILVPLLKPFKRLETDFTPFRITVSAVNRTFSPKRAMDDFGYQPRVDMDEALKRTLLYFSFLKREDKE